MSRVRHIVKAVEEGSIARELDIEPGDELLSINGSSVKDVFDYHYLLNEEYVEILIRKAGGEEWELEIEKEYEEDLGIIFENEFMDDYRSCSNRCIFCFIDQMPPGMRKTLYFKDDDSRLSFLQGNYVTLTNMSDQDMERIIRYHLEPINISVHTVNPALRCEMLHNRFAGDICEKIQKLYDAGIGMNGQIVLCRGINDGKSWIAPSKNFPNGFLFWKFVGGSGGADPLSGGIVSAGTFQKEDALQVIRQVESWQKKILQTTGSHFVHCSDEWYILAEKELPEQERYDGYPQLENGVGMLRLLCCQIKKALAERTGSSLTRKISLATGELPYEFLKKYIIMIQEKYPGVQADLYAVKNHFFGERITVSGLLTGQDLKEQLKGRPLGEELLLPCNMLREGEEVFLDDMTVGELQETLGVSIRIVGERGEDFVRAVLGEKPDGKEARRQNYEQTDCSHCGQAECGEIHTI